MNTHVIGRSRFTFLWIALIPVAFTVVGFWIGRQFQDEVAWITHTYDVRTAIRDTVILAWNAERDLRNYLLSGQESYLRLMEKDASMAPKRLEELRKLTADNPVQQRNLERFKPLIETALADLRQILSVRQARGSNSPLTPAEVSRGQMALEQIRDVSIDMMQEEERLLVERSHVGSRLVWQAEIVFASAIVLTLLLLFWAGRLIRDYAAKRDGAEQALQQKVAEIGTLNRDLQLRVDERTAELRESAQKLANAYQASRLLASIVESSDDAIVGKSLDGVVRSWNAGAERIYGYKAEEILSHNISRLVPPDRLKEELEILERLRNGDRVDHFETVRLRKSGTLVDVSLTVSPMRDEAGRIVGASHVSRDITDQKKNAAMMLQAQKLESLGVLAGGIAHDFNNLLVGILGNASLALDQIYAESPARTSIQEVVAAGERAAALTRQMLAYSGRGHFVLDRIDLSTYVRETIPLIHAAVSRAVELRLDLEENLPAIEADTSQIQQLVMNLVINGAEAIPDGKHGTVTITTRRQVIDETYIRALSGAAGDIAPGMYVLLKVRDTGSGMDDATRTRIFEPFFTTKFTGRGLGLAAALGIVRGHSGSIQVSSSPGHGSVFRVLFPALAIAPEPPRRRQDARDLSGRGGVLVIDDEEIVRRMAQQALEHYGYSVWLAADGERGLDVFRDNADRIHCVVLDMTMPIMGGEETLERLKSLRPNVPVILSSGFSEVEAVRRFRGKRLAGFIQKPYTVNILSQKIKDAIVGAGAHLRPTGS